MVFKIKSQPIMLLLMLSHTPMGNINSNQFTGLVFLDLTKALDSVNHDILLLKLEHYGLRGSANQLIKSFLSRKQFVFINPIQTGRFGNFVRLGGG